MANNPVAQPSPPARRLIDRGSGLNVAHSGRPRHLFSDFYHSALRARWSTLGVASVAYYFLANAVFALFYLAGGDDIAGAHPGSFADAFFFSVQTMATIGYGVMAPQTFYANVLVAIEALVGALGFALATGLFFAKFARPTARVLFSKVAVVAPRDGRTSLMFRMANERANQVIDAQVHVSLARTEVTVEGERVRRFYDLELVRTRTPLFVLTWTVIHPITEASPLWGVTLESLRESEVEIMVTMMGLDETFSQSIHARWSYVADEIVWGARFQDVMSVLPDGRRHVNYARFDEVIVE